MPVLVERSDHCRTTRRLIDNRSGAEIPVTLRVLTGWVNRLKTAEQIEVGIKGDHTACVSDVAFRHTIRGSRCCINPPGSGIDGHPAIPPNATTTVWRTYARNNDERVRYSRGPA